MSQEDLSISILVVDDDAMVKQVLVDYLDNIGFANVTIARTPNQALKLVQDSSFKCDLVISDWEMPEVSGLTLLKAVRKNSERVGLKFLMVTSQRSMERFKITQAAQWQVNGYLIKPFREDVFREKIWETMGWHGQTKVV